MSIRDWIAPIVTVGVLGALGFAGYVTRERWVPVVFPTPAAKPAGDGHDHGGGGHEGHDHAGHSHGPAGDRVKLSTQAQANLGLDVDALEPRPYWRTVLIPGIVVDRPGESDRGVTTRLAGVVVDIKARPGDTVKAGDPLFVLQLASEYAQAALAEVARAAQDLRLATAMRDTTAGLLKVGTAKATDLAEDEAQVKRFATQVQTVRRQLQTLGFTPVHLERDGKTYFVWRYRPGQRVRLKVPIEKLGDAVLVLPAGAIVREGAEAFVFVQNGDVFVRKPVRVLYENRIEVVLANDGSVPGAAFVVRNQAPALNRAIKAEAGGDGHHHDH